MQQIKKPEKAEFFMVILCACRFERAGKDSTEASDLTTAPHQPEADCEHPAFTPMHFMSKTLLIHIGTDLKNISNEPSRSTDLS